jgi:hypothetical protein
MAGDLVAHVVVHGESLLRPPRIAAHVLASVGGHRLKLPRTVE